MGASLLQAFAAVPDPRAARGRRHPLAAILTLAVAAMLADARSLYAIAQWGRLQSAETVRALGFTRAKTPTVSTLHEVFKTLDVAAFEAALAQWAQAALAPQPAARLRWMARRCGASTARSCPGCGWSRRTMWRPAWCWCNRGVRT